ncbi:hypothetical protein HX052_12880 [Myroides marinus]|uniref:hypothetical protein n=1 Tax=Myroides marinus TaxID=703342 RepID=UPI0025784DBC|nr:hypothetical protein [Myroides marinus]MDM1369463.1 hypothetical protein [Myroides marinus]MDM1372838.1 hypothetical protein [Myroides marinus]MDM1375570.1 hypothetical protein [Myroides marinus]MDM1382053.1 hypothetical protein [Myroides marinus]MDM1390851.1 hypothetical protein [Myroides marinus]
MRKLVLAIALCSIVSVQAVAHTVSNELSNIAYEQETKGDKYAILVQSIKNLRSSIMTGSEIKKVNPKADFQIVIMGQMVQELNNKELRSELDAANKAGIKLVVCEFALKVYGVTLNDLPLYFIGTPNAHKYMFQLQENDYNSLSI